MVLSNQPASTRDELTPAQKAAATKRANRAAEEQRALELAQNCKTFF
jgi:hypothetical protein